MSCETVRITFLLRASHAVESFSVGPALCFLLRNELSSLCRSIPFQRMSSPAVTTSLYRLPDSSTGTVTSWIPFNTPYSMHLEDCTSAFWRWDSDSDLVAWDPGYGISVNQNLRCVPKAVTTWWAQDLLGTNTETVVSIGPLTCPQAFSQVATHVEDDIRTRVACCPS